MKGSRRGRPPVPAPATETPPVGVRGTLYVVATPIGNLEDITLRALRILREVALVAAEDTRRTANLLRHYQIATPLLSLHEHNERGRVDRIVGELGAGKSIALVSDAGTPGISDPGAVIVRAVRDAGFRVDPLPGPSAVIAALSAAGLETEGFAFLGFPPPTGRVRRDWLGKLAVSAQMVTVLFEAPHRLQRLLSELDELLGKRQIIVARELTKKFEEWARGTPGELKALIPVARGEFVVIIPPPDPPAMPDEAVDDNVVADCFGQLTDNVATTRREAIRHTAQKLGLAPKAVFDALERVKHR